jgi:hypothetical protein
MRASGSDQVDWKAYVQKANDTIVSIGSGRCPPIGLLIPYDALLADDVHADRAAAAITAVVYCPLRQVFLKKELDASSALAAKLANRCKVEQAKRQALAAAYHKQQDDLLAVCRWAPQQQLQQHCLLPGACLLSFLL